MTFSVRSSRSQMFFKIGVFKNFAIFKGKHLRQEFLFNKEVLGQQLYQKETPAQVFFCEYCEISSTVHSSCVFIFSFERVFLGWDLGSVRLI